MNQRNGQAFPEITFMTVCLLISLIFLASRAEGSTHGPICQWYGDPCRSMAVHWIESDSKPERNEFTFFFQKSGGAQWTQGVVLTRSFGPTDHRAHSADLNGLNPNTRYSFRIMRGDLRLGTWFFRTAPENPVDGLTFVTGGDMFHTREMLNSMNQRAGTEEPLFALLGGDLALADGVNADRWLEWVQSWSQYAVSPSGLSIPMIPVIGNHEVKGAAYRPTNAPGREDAPFFYSLFLGMEQGSRFAVDFGSYLTVIGLDSGHTENVASQTPWLKEALGKRGDVTSKFVSYHRPAWGTGAKPDAVEIRKAWCPVFEEYGVDAVFESDHHVYKRTHRLTGGERDDTNGVLYLGDGAWGVRTRAVAADVKRTRPFLAQAESVNHLIKVILRKEAIQFQALTASGVLIDSTEIIRGNQK